MNLLDRDEIDRLFGPRLAPVITRCGFEKDGETRTYHPSFRNTPQVDIGGGRPGDAELVTVTITIVQLGRRYHAAATIERPYPPDRREPEALFEPYDVTPYGDGVALLEDAAAQIVLRKVVIAVTRRHGNNIQRPRPKS